MPTKERKVMDPIQLAGDPVLKLITSKGISSILFGVSYSLLYNLLRMLAALRADHLFTSGTVIGFFNDPAMYLNLITGSAIWAYYAWIPRGITIVISGLYQNGVIGDPDGDSDFNQFTKGMGKWLGKRWMPILAMLISILATFIVVFPGYLERYRTQDSWSMADPINLGLSTGWMLFNLYSIFLLLAYCGVSIIWLRRLFVKFHINVKPLHPDGAGGLSSLGNFSLSLSYVITLVGILIVSTPVLRNYLATSTLQFKLTTDIVLGFIAYTIAAPLVFFFPLSVAHNAMTKAKSEFLLRIAQRFDHEYEKVQNALAKENINIEKELKAIKELQILHGTVEKFPVWPFNTTNITRFTTSFISPFFLAILTEVVGFFVTPRPPQP